MAERHDSKEMTPDQHSSLENDAHSKDDHEAAQALLRLRDDLDATTADLVQQDPSLQSRIDTLKKRYKNLDHLTNHVNPPEHEPQHPDQVEFNESADTITQFILQNMPKNVPLAMDDLHQREDCEPEEMRIIARSRVMSMLGIWTTLRDVVQYHEARIRRLWTKMTKVKRVRILRESLAQLPDHYRAAVKDEMIVLPNPCHPIDLRRFLWPMMNLENLSKSRNFLSLLNARTRQAPHYFMDADLTSSAYPPHAKLFGPSWLKDVQMLFSTDDFPNRFGVLLIEELEHSQRPHEWSRCYNGVDSFFILEFQHQLLGDLLAVVSRLVESIPRLDDDDMSWPYQPEPPPLLPEFDNLTGAPTLQCKIVDDFFGRPPMTDWSRVKLLFNAAYTAIRDHFWQLREASPC